MPSSSKIMERIAQDIHDGTIKKGDLIDPELLKHIADQLMHGVKTGFNTDLKTPLTSEGTARLMKSMETNVYKFSGFKTAAQIKEAKALLHDSKGEVRPFKDFKKDVLAIDATYNKTWLKTEYDTAARGSEMGRRWLEIKEEKDALPYLMYETVGDARVRPEHQDLDGIVRRVDDPFWKQYYPPNGWNCRCDVRQLPEDKSAKGSIDAAEDVPAMWRNNTGISGEVLKDDVYKSVASKQEQKEITRESMEIMNQRTAQPNEKTFRERNQEVYDLPTTEQYTKLAHYKNGGEVHIHKLVDHSEQDHPEVRRAAHAIAEQHGHTIKIVPKIHIDHPDARAMILPGAKQGKNPDLHNETTKEYIEVKRPVTTGDYLSNMRKIIAKGSQQADHVIVVMDQTFTEKRLADLAKERFYQLKTLQKITFQQGNDLTTYSR